MNRLLALFFWVLLCSVLFTCGASDNSWALGIGYQPAVMQQYLYLMKKHPNYPKSLAVLISPEDAMTKGVDCSMYEYLVHKWAGVPGVQRVTAERMAQGMGGWVGYDVDFEELEPFDILFFHLGSQPGKIIDHTGTKLSEDTFTHSGRSHNGPSAIPFRSSWIKNYFYQGRHITIGE